MTTYELQSICDVTGEIEILAECDSDSFHDARKILIERGGIESMIGLFTYEIAWDNGRVTL
jgi:hypothetical protein